MDVSLSELQEMVMDSEAQSAATHGVAKSRTRLSDWTELSWTETLQNNKAVWHETHSSIKISLDAHHKKLKQP